MDGRKAVVRNAGNAQLRSELGVFGDVVFVLEAVVSGGELVDHARIDGPEVRETNLGAADELALDRIDRLSGERREASAVAVEAAIGSGDVGDEMVDLGLRAAGKRCGGLRHGSEHLGCSHVGASKHSHFAI